MKKLILTALAVLYLPIAVASNTTASASDNSFYVINSEEKAWAWGRNIGDGSIGKRITATPFTTLSDFHIVKIAAIENYGAAVTNDGRVLIWGSGSLGDGIENSASYNTALLTPLSGIVDAVATNSYRLVVKENGEVWGWGFSVNGILGVNHDEGDERTDIPVKIQGLSNIIKISSQGSYVLALDSHGDVWSWGNNAGGFLGNGTRTGDGTNASQSKVHYSPAKIPGLANITAIETGGGYSMALSADGNVFSWGYVGNGQLGHGDISGVRVSAPAQIGLLKNIKAISAGDGHAAAINYEGEVWAWGGNHQGQVGDGTKGNNSEENGSKDAPVKLAISDVVAVAASEYSTVAIKSDGSVWTWGANGDGQIGINISSSWKDIYLEPQQVIASSLDFLNLGVSSLSDKVIVDSNLNIQIPSAIYQSPGNDSNIWVNLEFKGIDSDGDYIWRLKDYGNN